MTERWPQLMSKATAAEYLDVSTSTLNREIAGGRIRARLMRGKPMYSRDDLDSYIESLEIGRGECAANIVRERKEREAKAAKRAQRQANKLTEQVSS